MDQKQVVIAALKEIEEERFKSAVAKQKEILLWPWWKKIFPYRLKIKLIDLRKGE